MSDYLKRLAEALKKREAPMGPDAWDWQQFADASPTGSVNAPGGVSQPQERDRPQRLGKLLAGASMLPGPSGDLLGPISDAYMYATEPESRTPGNFALSALGALPFLPSLATVYHGSPHKFDAFDLSKIGTGEGAQAYGHGLYFADNPDVAMDYRKTLSANRPDAARTAYAAGEELAPLADNWATQDPKSFAAWALQDVPAGLGNDQKAARAVAQARKRWPDAPLEFEDAIDDAARAALANAVEVRKGALYTVDLPDEAIAKMLDWDKPLSEQAPEVQRALMNLPDAHKLKPEMTGAQLLESRHLVPGEFTDKVQAAERLKKLGIPGIRYLDGGSRGAGQGTSNYVVFDDKLPKILKRE